MKTALSTLAMGIAALTLAGCAGGPEGGGGARPATIQHIGNEAELGDVISLLDQGDEKGARRKLDVMMKRDPNDARSKALRDSITAEPVAALGSTAFDYSVEPGDTMQTIAQRFLGDRLRFYLLARYNKIAVPAGIKVGQTIRVPGEAPAPRLVPMRPKGETAPTSAPARAAPKPAPAKAAAPARPNANPRRAAQLRAAGLADLNKGQVGQAVGLLGQALAADPGNALIQRDLDRARRIQATVKARK